MEMGPPLHPRLSLKFHDPYPLRQWDEAIIVRHGLKLFEPILVRLPAGARLRCGIPSPDSLPAFCFKRVGLPKRPNRE